MDLEAFRFAKAPRKSEPDVPTQARSATKSTGLHCYFGSTRADDNAEAGAGRKASPKKSAFKRKAEDSVILCKTCRHSPTQLLQQSIGSFVVRATASQDGDQDLTPATSDLAGPIDNVSTARNSRTCCAGGLWICS